MRHSITRIIMTFALPFEGESSNTDSILKAVLAQNCKKISTVFLSGPGGFYYMRTPFLSGESTWLSIVNYVDTRIDKYFSKFESEWKLLGESVKFFTFGVDVYADEEKEIGDQPHAELVVVYSILERRVVHITGKTWPTPDKQLRMLIPAPVDSHFLTLSGKRICLLGCHDLNIFSGRSYRQLVDPAREKVSRSFREKVAKYDPEIIIQHPHTADSPNVWRLGWAGLNEIINPQAIYCGTGKFYNNDDPVRGNLDETLQSTKRGSVCDLIVSRKAGKIISTLNCQK